MVFKNTYGRQFTINEVVRDMCRYVSDEMNRVYHVVIGTDSQSRKLETVFVTAVIIHRVGKCAKFYYTKRRIFYDIDIYSRIIQETNDSLKILMELENSHVREMVGKENFEVHIDVGYNGRSQKVMATCVNFVKGLGYNYKVKPDSFGASHVADRFTK